MRTTLLASLAMLALGASTGAAAVTDTVRAEPFAAVGFNEPRQTLESRDDDFGRESSQYDRVRVSVWMDERRDLFSVGQRSRVLVRADRDSYMAVLHIDTNGDVDVLFPSYSDDGFVRGGRVYPVHERGSQYVTVRGGYGIGYIFAVASEEPLDLRRLRDVGYGRSVQWSRERNVYGDPFAAMERLERLLVPDWDYGEFGSDYYSYHVGRRYSHPRYACYDSYGSWYSSRAPYYDTCDRVRGLLVHVPYYYDTRHYRGDRRVVYTRNNGYYDRAPVQRRGATHGYKERTDVREPSTRRAGYERRPEPSGNTPVAREEGGRQTEPQQQEPRSNARPERSRPTFQRRPAEAEPARREEPRREEPRREEPRREEPRREEPRREEPRRAEPRREEPRSAPPRREETREPSSTRSAPPERTSPRARPPRE
ncbi:MAG TPA: DUF4384 domain-containing protein [Longimicrobium sp.]|nr:DUF4384 domain-containing protein [Longimicrobium sp.]